MKKERNDGETKDKKNEWKKKERNDRKDER